MDVYWESAIKEIKAIDTHTIDTHSIDTHTIDTHTIGTHTVGILQVNPLIRMTCMHVSTFAQSCFDSQIKQASYSMGPELILITWSNLTLVTWANFHLSCIHSQLCM